jgi:hypothetical protein
VVVAELEGAGDRGRRPVGPRAGRRGARALPRAASREPRAGRCRAGSGPKLLADAGYFSERNVEAAAERGLDPHLATGQLKHGEQPLPPLRGSIPKSASAKQRMARKLRTKQGRSANAKRNVIVEPVFGQLDTVQSGRRLLLRGERAASCQWRLNCAHNLLKLHRAGGLGFCRHADRRSGAPEAGGSPTDANRPSLRRSAP